MVFQEIPRYFLSLTVGLGISSIVIFTVHEHLQILRNLFSIYKISENEIHQIWDENKFDEEEEKELVDMNFILQKVYEREEQYLIKMRSFKYSSYLFEIYLKLGLMDKNLLDDIDEDLRTPLPLKRCRNIIKQLADAESGPKFTQLLFPNILMNTEKSSFANAAQSIIPISLRHDLSDFTEIQQQKARMPINYVQSSEYHDSYQYFGEINSQNITPIPNGNRLPRKSDVFDYLEKL
jgi:hypothetical protein